MSCLPLKLARRFSKGRVTGDPYERYDFIWGRRNRGAARYATNETRLFSRTVAVLHPPRECPESDCITATFTHSQPAFEVAHLAAGGKLFSPT